MNEKKECYQWAQPEWPGDVETLRCPEYDGYEDFRRDPTGYYVLIRIEWDGPRIAVAVCDKDHRIEKIFKGKRAPDIYNAIFRYEKKHKLQWFQDKTHIAYLGKELKKAELAIVIGIKDYFQE